jgi:antitoxin FitA
MATIQIRDVPDDVHDVLTGLAEEAGQSLQAYMRQQVVEMVAARGRKAEAIARLNALLERDGGAGWTAEQIVADLEADRR